MSAQAIRDWFRDKIRASLPEGCEYVETINFIPDLTLLKAPWVTLEFQPGEKDRTSLGLPAWWREAGRVFVKINTTAGVGEEEGMSLATLLKSLFLIEQINKLGEYQYLRIVSIQPPDTWPGIDGRFFVTTVPVDFVLDTFE